MPTLQLSTVNYQLSTINCQLSTVNYQLQIMSRKKVLLTGATGRTGSLVLEKLRQHTAEFESIGFARSESKAKEIFGSTEGFMFGDIKDKSTIDNAIVGCEALIILTSAIPQMKAPPAPGQRPEFHYPPGGMPEEVDYYGQKNQIDAAKKAGVKQVVLVGSMGGTNPHHPLNKMGNGNILIWKRKAEEYLIDSGIDYTIIHAGGLVDEPSGEREFVVDKGDRLLANADASRSIPRADLAELVVRALMEPHAKNKVFDVVCKLKEDSPAKVDTDFAALFAATTSEL